MQKQFDYKSAIILGMHDAIVSLTGLIAGLYFAFTDTNIIVVSCIISSITASLSMGAANYLAVKTVNQAHAIHAALYTAGAYMLTCILLILPFCIFYNRKLAFLSVFIIAILIIYMFNFIFYKGSKFYKHFYEMLAVCFTISVIAFIIGQCAKYFLDV
jgi:VIT1/CCC1 family predicted Fe2+/Mn2+ transporter